MVGYLYKHPKQHLFAARMPIKSKPTELKGFERIELFKDMNDFDLTRSSEPVANESPLQSVFGQRLDSTQVGNYDSSMEGMQYAPIRTISRTSLRTGKTTHEQVYYPQIVPKKKTTESKFVQTNVNRQHEIDDTSHLNSVNFNPETVKKETIPYKLGAKTDGQFEVPLEQGSTIAQDFEYKTVNGRSLGVEIGQYIYSKKDNKYYVGEIDNTTGKPRWILYKK